MQKNIFKKTQAPKYNKLFIIRVMTVLNGFNFY